MWYVEFFHSVNVWDVFPEGFKAMVPAIMILSFAWTLKAMTDSLGAAEFVDTVMQGCAGSFMKFLPAIIFLVGAGLAFATGTSWVLLEF